MTQNQIQQDVKEYYGTTLESSEDLKTDACCDLDTMPNHIKPLIKNIHDEVLDKFYGCGSPIPNCLEGKTVIDLGCGTGRDSYILSQLVGESGRVIGIDMTDEQLTVANKHIGYHMDKFGYSKPNVEFHKGVIEDLASIGIADARIDLVVSNCVINLSSDKSNVFSEIFRILKPNGELYFSDVFAGRRAPKALQEDKVILGECLGGALYFEDFRRMLNDIGCMDYRIVSNRRLELHDEKIIEQVGDIDFYSSTVRTFNTEFEDRCEDYGHTATYKGSIEGLAESFTLDAGHVFITGETVAVCGNTAKMLKDTRYAEHFDVTGSFCCHKGIFEDCVSTTDSPEVGSCC